MVTIGKLARRFGLSRSTLLYYDKIGLLSPSGRTEAAYRVYGDRDISRLEQICSFREAGVPLRDIKLLLDAKDGSDEQTLADVLESRLEAINREISHLREQQTVIVGILKSGAHHEHVGMMDKARWVALLRASGFSEEDMNRWHAEFERTAPDEHQEFLEFICIPKNEIKAIRAKSKGEWK